MIFLRKQFYMFFFLLVIVSTSLVAEDANISTISFTVSKQNPLYECELAAKTTKLPPNVDSNLYKVNREKTLEENYKNLILSSRIFNENASQETLDFYLNNAKAAYELYPVNPAIVSYYAAVIQYADPGQIAKSVALLLPYIKDAKEYPGIYRAIRNIFARYVNNPHSIDSDKGAFFSIVNEIFKAKDSDTLLKELTLLSNYWTSKIDVKYSSQAIAELVKTAKETLASENSEAQAVEIWNKVAANAKKQYDAELELAQKMKSQQAFGEMLKANAAREAERRQEDFHKSLKALDDLKTLPNEMSKLEMILGRLASFRRELQTYSAIPNYQELKKTYPETAEADVINMAYRAFVLEDYKKCLEEIAVNKNLANDTRILFVKIYCMQNLKYPENEILAVVDNLSKVDPKNERVFMMKKILETRLGMRGEDVKSSEDVKTAEPLEALEE